VGVFRSERAGGAVGERNRSSDGPGAWRRPLPRLPLFLVIAAGILTALSLGLPNIAPNVDFLAAPGSPVRMFFGVSEEMNLPTFFSVMIMAAASACQVLAGRLIGGTVGKAFYVTAVVLLAMAFDDFVALHERLDSLGEAILPGVTGYLWVVPGALLGLLVVLAFWWLGKNLRGRVRRDLGLGLALFLFAALGLETVNGMLDHPGTDGPPLQIVTHLEEFTEDLGMILVLRGSLGVLEMSCASGLCLRINDRAVKLAPSVERHSHAQEFD
jgi:hypothetical protein